MVRSRAPKRPQGRLQEKLSSLSREVLQLRLQALNLPIIGSKQQLLSRLKTTLTKPSPRGGRAASSRTAKKSRNVHAHPHPNKRYPVYLPKLRAMTI